MKYFIYYCLMAVFLWPAAAHAAQPCQNPAGDEGDQVYNITYHVMQYCNGSHWVAMGSVMGQGDNLGHHTAGQALDMSGFRIENLAPPTADNHAATRAYVTSAADAKVSKAGDVMTGFLSLSGAPTANEHAANKEYVDLVVASAGGAIPVDNPTICQNRQPMRWIWDGDESAAVLTCSDDCTTGGPGSVCMDGAVFMGIVGANRLYAAPTDETGTYQWKTSNDATAGTQSDTDGLANTNAMMTADAAAHPAARQCKEKPPAGTWYLPAKDELALLDPNKSFVPNLPGDASYYWSSTEYTNNRYAWVQRFSDGNQTYGFKITNYRVRCVRR